jgi:predicted adenine nucleotide alpha hydrolase (AANH) superfamily ATPase
MTGAKKRLLLHVCCGPCSTHVIEVLRPEFEVSTYFYNPNIHPIEEYELRLEAMRKVSQMAGVPLVEGEYEVEHWFRSTKGFETEREGGKRCSVCFRLRLEKTAVFARNVGYQYYATTLTVSPHKDARIINETGIELQKRYGIDFYEADFKKKDGFKRSCQLSKEYQLYRQHYCGCVFSSQPYLPCPPEADQK